MFAAPADSGGVDEQKLFAIPLVGNIDRVASCARQFADNGAFGAHDRIDQRRFADIRATNDSQSERIFDFRFSIFDR